jgi:hypothetical protein
VALTASPPSLIANGQQSTITATVTDFYGVPVPNNVINWSKTDGAISASQATTNASGQASITLTSSWTIGGTAITASTAENDGSNAIWVPFVDSFVAYPATYTGWANNGGVYSCSAWSPDVSTVDTGTWFTQTATCYQNYYRYRQDRQQSIVTGAVTNVGGQVAEYTTGTVGVSQGAVGTRYVAPPTPPTPPPSSCRYSNPWLPPYDLSSELAFVINPWTGVSFIAPPPEVPDEDHYNGATNGPDYTGLTTQVWPGYIDYRGYRYTSGRFRDAVTVDGNTNSPLWYYFELCRAPL